jgi:hypothetical protein
MVFLWERALIYAFISYVRQNSEIVDRLAEGLRSYGVRVWLDRNSIAPGQYWQDAINNAIQNGAFFIACFSKELNARDESRMHGELSLAIDRLRNMPRERVWFIPVLLNDTKIPPIPISNRETLENIQAVELFRGDWNEGVIKILHAMKLDDPDHRRVLHLIELIRYHLVDRKHAIKQLQGIGAAARLAVPAPFLL